jgi:hypothetical protein
MVNNLIIDNNNEDYVHEYSDEEIINHIKKNINYGIASQSSNTSSPESECCGVSQCSGGENCT